MSLREKIRELRVAVEEARLPWPDVDPNEIFDVYLAHEPEEPEYGNPEYWVAAFRLKDGDTHFAYEFSDKAEGVKYVKAMLQAIDKRQKQKKSQPH